MERLKINTVSGNSFEKPIVTAFKSNGGEYVVLDNEMNGTMGLPIILVTKLINNTLTIVPDSEWNAVKEALRLIISGSQTDYIILGNVINAEDMFFKQLTLPVASFEALKNNYKPVGSVNNPVEPQVQMESQPVMENVMPESQVMTNINPVHIETPIMESQATSPVEMPHPMPEVNVAPEAPIMPSAPVQSQSVAEVAPYTEPVTPMPSVEPIPEEHEEVPVDFTADKEAFLKACENMFDALVAKFNNK